MLSKEEARLKINELVSRFELQYDFYKKSDYNETLTRRDFIDPFFKALGWDVDNENGYSESYREVIHEDKVKVGGATKAPDYSFRLVGGKRLFFVEAKKPSVQVKDDTYPAYQIRRYGWSAKMPISIITDFEEFAVYDCTKKPKPTDQAAVARIAYLTFKDYLKEFDFIWETFSKEHVLKGSFDKFIQSDTRKKGTATVDKEFLLSLDNWRTYLATSISWNNKNLAEDEINFAVQQTIDRIIFLRIAEDRGVEPYGNLKNALKQGDYYQNLFNIFKEADDKYNSGLFDFQKDKISLNLKIDNKVIKSIINELYYPESPYEFSVLAVEILGSAYEQFLGKVIRITPAHHAKIEEKPEVRKAGGVYYTPQYIVDYIVKNTVGKLTEGKTPEEVSTLKIVDPACGSGSFLIGAYQFLLDWHKNYYSEKVKASKGSKEHPLTPDGNLTTAVKKQILLNNIYGVDIDVNAVEVTKLSLLLKCLEGETEASISSQFRLFNERVLPTLDNNIKSGNSLIDIDFYSEQLDFGEDKKIKPFNWQKAFPEVFNRTISSDENELKEIAKKAKEHARQAMEYASELENRLNVMHDGVPAKGSGGFDAVIGNPPYGYMIPDEQRKYFESKYLYQDYQKDLYLLFLERYEHLLMKSGFLGIIISNTWLQSITLKKIRSYLISHYSWKKVLLIPDKVFKAVVDTHVIIFQKSKSALSNNIDIELLKLGNVNLSHTFVQGELPQDGRPINIAKNKAVKEVFDKITTNSRKLSDLCQVYNGVKPFEKGKGNPPQTQKICREKPYVKIGSRPGQDWRPLLRGSLINRYEILWAENYWISYGPWLAAQRDPQIFENKEMIFIRQTGDSLISTYGLNGFIARNNLHIIIPKSIDIKYLLGLLNSNLMDFVYSYINPEKGEALAEVKKKHVEILPIKEIQSSDKEGINKQKEIVDLVENLLKFKIEKRNAKLPSTVEQIEHKISYCEDRINTLVYQLYGLAEEEIKIVQGITSNATH